MVCFFKCDVLNIFQTKNRIRKLGNENLIEIKSKCLGSTTLPNPLLLTIGCIQISGGCILEPNWSRHHMESKKYACEGLLMTFECLVHILFVPTNSLNNTHQITPAYVNTRWHVYNLVRLTTTSPQSVQQNASVNFFYAPLVLCFLSKKLKPLKQRPSKLKSWIIQIKGYF